MQFIDIHDVGYGECIVFEGDKNKILMIDCGSMNTILKGSKIKFKDYVINFVVPRYSEASERNFLLTHFHRDHYCGLKYILKSEKNFFDNIYIPYPALNQDNRALLLEIAIYVFVFLKRQQLCASMSTSALFIFEFLRKRSYKSKIFSLKKGNIFKFSGVNYKVLSPYEETFPYSQNFSQIVYRLDELLKSSWQTEIVEKFFYLKNLFCEEYVKCSKLCQKGTFLYDEEIEQLIEKLSNSAVELNKLSKNLMSIDVINEILLILNDEKTRFEYSLAQNSASIVFQNEKNNSSSGNNVLMTGDVTSEILKLLENDLFQFYNVIKVPHHGTNNYCSEVLDRVSCSHLIISNGEYHAGGKISAEYAKHNAIKHCTNSKNCDYLQKNNSCCNRLIFCDSLSKNGEHSTSCKNKFISTSKNKCGIYVINVNGDRGCYCD